MAAICYYLLFICIYLSKAVYYYYSDTLHYFLLFFFFFFLISIFFSVFFALCFISVEVRERWSLNVCVSERAFISFSFYMYVCASKDHNNILIANTFTFSFYSERFINFIWLSIKKK